MPQRAITIFIAIAAALLVSAPLASASKTQESIFQDDGLLTSPDDNARNAALDRISGLGADTIHALVIWNRIAPGAGTSARPAGFDAGNPAAYPAGSWDHIDSLVRGSRARGLDLLLTPTTPSPGWASKCSGSVTTRRLCRPDPAEYSAFFTALARRYSGSYADENQGGGVLPRVGRWSAMNEPNLGSWLSPQFTGSSKRPTPASPRIYRSLVYGAADALAATGHGGDQLLLGETAPIARSSGSLAKRTMAPVTFYRNLFCIDSRGRALRGSAARSQGCTGRFRRLPVSGVSHHPYGAGALRAPLATSKSGDLPLSATRTLVKVVDQGARRGRLRSRAPIYFTEYGFQTRPPDRFGVSLAKQAEYINQADWISWNNSRIAAVAQYELTDPTSVTTFNTGLELSNGKAKPAFAAYRLPIWVVRSGRSVKVWGQARPATSGVRDEIAIERRSSSKRKFVVVKRVKISGARNYFYTRVSKSGGQWRLRWQGNPPYGTPYTSRIASVARR